MEDFCTESLRTVRGVLPGGGRVASEDVDRSRQQGPVSSGRFDNE